jgi:hypothetical protein
MTFWSYVVTIALELLVPGPVYPSALFTRTLETNWALENMREYKFILFEICACKLFFISKTTSAIYQDHRKSVDGKKNFKGLLTTENLVVSV